MTDKPIFLFNCLYPTFTGRTYAGATFSPFGVSPTINTQGGGNRQPYILTYDPESKDTPSQHVHRDTPIHGVKGGRLHDIVPLQTDPGDNTSKP